MTLQCWRKRLVEALRRQGLPNNRVERLAEELTDHALDLFSENASMDVDEDFESRMGTREQLATVAKDQFNRSSFAGRHPALTFIAGPVVTVMGCLFTTILLILSTIGIANWLKATNLPLSTFDVVIIGCINLTARFLPFVLSTWIFVHLGRRSGRHSWSVPACGIIAVLGLLFTSTIIPPTEKNEWIWVIDIIQGERWKMDPDHVLQAFVPFGLGAWFYWQSARDFSNKLSMQ